MMYARGHQALFHWAFYRRTPLRFAGSKLVAIEFLAPRSTVEHPDKPPPDVQKSFAK